MKRKSESFDEPASPRSKPSKKRAIEVDTPHLQFRRGLFDHSQLATYKESYATSTPYVSIVLKI